MSRENCIFLKINIQNLNKIGLKRVLQVLYAGIQKKIAKRH